MPSDGLVHKYGYINNGGRGGLVAKSCLTLATPWTVALQAPLSMGFSRQEYWLPFPSPGDLTNPGIEPRSPALQADYLPAEPQGKPSEATSISYLKDKVFSLLPKPSQRSKGQIQTAANQGNKGCRNKGGRNKKQYSD